jgi:hypothetical protein
VRRPGEHGRLARARRLRTYRGACDAPTSIRAASDEGAGDAGSDVTPAHGRAARTARLVHACPLPAMRSSWVAEVTASCVRRISSRTRRSSASATGDSFAEPCALEFDLIISTARRVYEVRISLLRSLLLIRDFEPSHAPRRFLCAHRPPLTLVNRTLNAHTVTRNPPHHRFPGLDGMAFSTDGAHSSTHVSTRRATSGRAVE